VHEERKKEKGENQIKKCDPTHNLNEVTKRKIHVGGKIIGRLCKTQSLILLIEISSVIKGT
jgi:hypothetical protein